MDFAQFINSKNDINNLKTKFPHQICEYLKKEYQKSLVWQKTGVLDKKSDGVEDETRKIEKIDGTYIQFELKMNPKALICAKLGYSENELKEVIKNIEAGIL